MYEKIKTGNRLSFYKRIIAVVVITVLLYTSVVPMRVFSSLYTATIGINVPRVSFYYDDNELDVQYCTTINGTYTTINSGFILDSDIAALYFKIIGTAYTDVLRDGIAISKDTNDIYTINNITSNTSITIGTVVNLNVSHGSIVIGKTGSGGRQYTYSDSNGVNTGTHNTRNIYCITGTTGDTTNGSGNSITLIGDGDFNVILDNVGIHTGSPGADNVGKGLRAPISTNGVTGSGNINITIVGSNTLENVSANPSDSFAALEKTYTDSTLFINGNGTLNTIGGADSAGIGSSNNITNEYKRGTKNIIINNGTINATTISSQGAGIGSGDNCSAHNIRIYGGDITATGINNASGIGGSGSVNFVGASGEVYIYGGTINATSNGTGAGIGGGGSGNSSDAVGGVGTVYIYGGTITTNSIGGGSGGSYGGEATVNICGGIVTVTSSIGGGNSANGTGGSADIIISGGTITAANISGGHGFGGSHAGGTLHMTGGTAKMDHVCSEIVTTGLGDDIIPYAVTVTTNGTTPVANGSVTSINFNPALTDYGLTDIYTDNSGKLYLWLPSGTTVSNVTADGTTYTGIIQQTASISASASPIVVGTVLTGTLSGGTATTYQWQRYTGTSWEPISVATSNTYTVQASDSGKQLLVIINGTHSLPVYVPAPPSFTVTIPESIPVTTEGGSFSISGDRYYFEPTQYITVTCSGDFEMELTGTTGITLDYNLYTDKAHNNLITDNSVVATFTGSGTTTTALYYRIADMPVYAGTYTDTLTFTVTFSP